MKNGDFVLFQYPDYGTPNTHPQYMAHSGQHVRIVDSYMQDDDRYYRVMAADGWIGHALDVELIAL